jgi:hypothetical protein
MRVTTYRMVVIGSMLSSFLVGLHVPMLHAMIDHGAAPRWDVLTVTLLLAIITVACAWRLLRAPRPLGDRLSD